MTTFNSNELIEIDEECMFSYGITIYHTDTHPMYDLQSGKIINKVRDVKIVDHCWIGAHVTMLKKVELARDSIVDWGSIVSRNIYAVAGLTCPPEHCVIAGNSAKVVKTALPGTATGAGAMSRMNGKTAKTLESRALGKFSAPALFPLPPAGKKDTQRKGPFVPCAFRRRLGTVCFTEIST